MKKQTFIKPTVLADLGKDLANVHTDLELIRSFTNGFDRPANLNADELLSSYERAFKFMGLLHSKTQQLEGVIDEVSVVLMEAGNTNTLKEYLNNDELIEIED